MIVFEATAVWDSLDVRIMIKKDSFGVVVIHQDQSSPQKPPQTKYHRLPGAWLLRFSFMFGPRPCGGDVLVRK